MSPSSWQIICRSTTDVTGEQVALVLQAIGRAPAEKRLLLSKIPEANVDRVLHHPFEAFSCIANVWSRFLVLRRSHCAAGIGKNCSRRIPFREMPKPSEGPVFWCCLPRYETAGCRMRGNWIG
jgi:hypothetical protein